MPLSVMRLHLVHGALLLAANVLTHGPIGEMEWCSHVSAARSAASKPRKLRRFSFSEHCLKCHEPRALIVV